MDGLINGEVRLAEKAFDGCQLFCKKKGLAFVYIAGLDYPVKCVERNDESRVIEFDTSM